MAKFEYIVVDMFFHLKHFSHVRLCPSGHKNLFGNEPLVDSVWICFPVSFIFFFFPFFFILSSDLCSFFFSLPRLDSFLHHHEPRGTQKHDGLMKTSGQLYAICSDNSLDLRRGPLVLLEWCGVRLKITREAARQILIYLFICVVCLALRAGGPPK